MSSNAQLMVRRTPLTYLYAQSATAFGPLVGEDVLRGPEPSFRKLQALTNAATSHVTAGRDPNDKIQLAMARMASMWKGAEGNYRVFDESEGGPTCFIDPTQLKSEHQELLSVLDSVFKDAPDTYADDEDKDPDVSYWADEDKLREICERIFQLKENLSDQTKQKLSAGVAGSTMSGLDGIVSSIFGRFAC